MHEWNVNRMCARETQIMLDVDPRKAQPEHPERAEKLRQRQDEFGQIVDLIPQTIVV